MEKPIQSLLEDLQQRLSLFKEDYDDMNLSTRGQYNELINCIKLVESKVEMEKSFARSNYINGFIDGTPSGVAQKCDTESFINKIYK